jgi:hypothetical protein
VTIAIGHPFQKNRSRFTQKQAATHLVRVMNVIQLQRFGAPDLFQQRELVIITNAKILPPNEKTAPRV